MDYPRIDIPSQDIDQYGKTGKVHLSEEVE